MAVASADASAAWPAPRQGQPRQRTSSQAIGASIIADSISASNSVMKDGSSRAIKRLMVGSSFTALPNPAMRLRVIFALLVLSMICPAGADVGPPPPRPAGPASTTIRGLALDYQYAYWRGRRWLVVISSCASGTAACKDRDLVDCLVMFADGSVPTLADLIAADKKAASGPLQLRIERCAASAGSNDLIL
jgi:hypothetical protein